MHSHSFRIVFFTFLFFISINVTASDDNCSDYGFFDEDEKDCAGDFNASAKLNKHEEVQLFKEQCITQDLQAISVKINKSAKLDESTSAKLRYVKDQDEARCKGLKLAKFEAHRQNLIKMQQESHAEKNQSCFWSCINRCGTQSQVYDPQDSK